MDLIAQPSLIVHPHALVGDGRITEAAAFLHNETLGSYIKRTGVIVPAGPVAVWHNGYRVPDALWRRLIPRIGDQVVIRARVIGGGGGGKILRTVAMIALVVAAPYLAGAMGFVAGTVAYSIATAGIMIGGSLLINALLPPMTPTAAQLGTGAKYDSSPTYALSGGRNRMRPWEPMTLIFGRHKVVPDLGAKYYTEWVGDTQYLNQVFHFGLQAGDVDLVDFKIGATLIENYQDVQIQISGEDGKLTMFPGNVDTLDGFVLNYDEENIRTTPLDTTHINVDLAAQLFGISDNGGFYSMSSSVSISYRKVGDIDWINSAIPIDGEYATHYWSMQLPNGTQLSYGSINPAEHVEGERYTWKAGGYYPIFNDDPSGWPPATLEYVPPIYGYWHWTPHPHSLNRPWTGIAPDPRLSTIPPDAVSVIMRGARQEATRRTVSWDVPTGQYEIRIKKLTGDIKGARQSNETAVGQILCFQVDDADYTSQLRVALRIKATSQLNGAIDEFSATAIARASIWNEEEAQFEKQATRNAAWWFLRFAWGKGITGKGRIYGAGLATSEIDIESIRAWAAWCDQKKLTFDYVLDRKMSSAQVLQIIARAGRASPTWQTGKLGVVWDAADQPVVAMFGPFNIKAGTFKIDYSNDGSVDEFVLNFANEERNYDMDEVRVRVPGEATTNNPLQLDFDGCTNHEMAGREANLLAASQVWHRRRVSWETDIEGWVAGRGDVVQMSHDLTVWDYSGRLMGRSGNTITLSQSIPIGSGTMMIRDPEGLMKMVTVAGPVDETDTVTITTDMTGFQLPGDEGYETCEALDWAFFFDPMETPGRRFKIIEVKPAGEDGVSYVATDDDPEYYASETNPYQYTPPRDGAYLGGVIFGVTVTEAIVNVLADINNVQIGWALSVAMPVDVVIAVNGVAQPAVRVVDRKISIRAQTGDVLDITITPVSQAGRGKPAIQSYTVLGLTAPLPAVTGLTNVFRDGLTVLVWNRVVDVRQPDYEIRMGESWANSRTVAITPMLESLTVGNGLYWVAARFSAKGRVVYGPADSLNVSGASLVRNVLLTEVEDPAWSGTVGAGAYIHNSLLTLTGAGDILDATDILSAQDILWYGGAETYGTYESATTVDIGFVAPVRLDFSIDAYALNFGEDVLSMADVFANPDILNASNAQHWSVTAQYRTAGEDLAYTNWINYTPGLVNARYYQVRLVIKTDEPLIVPFVEHFTWIVDVPDLLQGAENVTIPDTGLHITYPKEFHVIPNVQIATFDAIDGDRYVLTNSDKTGFDIQLFNTSTAVERRINWISQGY